MSTPPHNKAFAPAARKERAETSEATNPRVGPKKVTACISDVVMCDGVRLNFVPLRRYAVANGVFG